MDIPNLEAISKDTMGQIARCFPNYGVCLVLTDGKGEFLSTTNMRRDVTYSILKHVIAHIEGTCTECPATLK
jgi:hypothetical protein